MSCLMGQYDANVRQFSIRTAAQILLRECGSALCGELISQCSNLALLFCYQNSFLWAAQHIIHED